MTACFIVRAQVADPVDRDEFDRWYQDEHLPDALETFNARRAWRGWSEVEPLVHLAFYEFEDLAGAQAILDSDGLKELVKEFDRLWQGRVTRTRELVATAQEISA